MSSTFASVATPTAAADPTKHVRFSLGMVLGVDDFTQEFAYHAGRARWHTRDLHGYGTVTGLQVSVKDAATARPRVVVAPGVAVSPSGEMIRVSPAQCAYLNEWLKDHEAEVRKILSPPGALKLYVVLCYRDCATDMVPVPGEPCRDETTALAPSRLKDDFRLELRLAPPPQTEEDAVRDFVAWLRRSVEITDEPGGRTSLDDLLKNIRDAVIQPPPPPDPPAPEPPPPADFLRDTPPVHMRIHTKDVCEFVPAVMRLWVTELRPLWRARWVEAGHDCCREEKEGEVESDDDCVLLAELNLNVTAALTVGAAPTVNEARRPLLLHTRMLQEWLVCGPPETDFTHPNTFAILSIPDPTTVRAWILHPAELAIEVDDLLIQVDGGPEFHTSQPVSEVAPNVFDVKLNTPLTRGQRVTVGFPSTVINFKTNLVRTLADELGEFDYGYLDRDAQGVLRARVFVNLPGDLNSLSDVEINNPQAGQVLKYDGASWKNLKLNHAELGGLAADDHKQYLLVNPADRSLVADLKAGAKKIVNLAKGTAPGEALAFEQAVKIGDPAGGDLSGSYPNPTVKGLQGKPVSNQAPTNGQVLTWAGGNPGSWTPAAPPSGAKNLSELGDVSVPSPNENDILTQKAGKWVAAPAPAAPAPPPPVSTGLVTFIDMRPQERRGSPVIEHKLPNDVKSFGVILGLVAESVSGSPAKTRRQVRIGDTDTWSPDAPLMEALYDPDQPKTSFTISVQDQRSKNDNDQSARKYTIRWWAIPASVEAPAVTVPVPSGDRPGRV